MPVDPTEGMAAALNDAWPGRLAAGMDWAWTCEHHPTLAEECRQRASAAWACALERLQEPGAWWAEAPAVGVTLGQWRVLLAAFARTHGLEPPGSRKCAPASEDTEIPSRPESATSGPARGATGPFATTTLPAGVPATSEDYQ